MDFRAAAQRLGMQIVAHNKASILLKHGSLSVQVRGLAARTEGGGLFDEYEVTLSNTAAAFQNHITRYNSLEEVEDYLKNTIENKTNIL